MSNQFEKLIDDIPQEVYFNVKALITDNIAIFKPKAFIINKKMCSEDYTFILPSSSLPPAQIGNKNIEAKKESLIVIGSEVEFLCNTYAPTLEYVNIVVKKDFFENVASEVTGKRNFDFSKIEYGLSKQLLRILSDFENEVIFYGNDCPLMMQSLSTQLVIQLLRDSEIFTRNISIEPAQNYHKFDDINCLSPAYYSMLSYYNKLLPINSKLTTREIEIAAHLMGRFDYDVIANKLFISRNTLKTHAKNIYKKLNVSNRKELSYKINETYYKI